MNSKKLLKEYPLSANVIKEWFLNKLLESIKKDESVPEEFKEYMISEGIDDDKMSIFIDSNGRGLFDLFDQHDIIIEIFLYPSKEFTVKIENQATTNSWKTRIEAEEFAIEAAFEILEKQLKEKENGEIILGTDSTDS